jgi:hypothetical protein
MSGVFGGNTSSGINSAAQTEYPTAVQSADLPVLPAPVLNDIVELPNGSVWQYRPEWVTDIPQPETAAYTRWHLLASSMKVVDNAIPNGTIIFNSGSIKPPVKDLQGVWRAENHSAFEAYTADFVWGNYSFRAKTTGVVAGAQNTAVVNRVDRPELSRGRSTATRSPQSN